MSPHIAPSMNERLVRLAARRAPTDLAARLEEEWLSDLQQRRSALSGLLFASGCLWATQVISLERAKAFSFATAPAGDGVAALMGDNEFGRASRRSLSMLLVIGAHAAVFAGLLLTVSGKIPVYLEPPLDVRTVTPPERHHETLDVDAKVQPPTVVLDQFKEPKIVVETLLDPPLDKGLTITPPETLVGGGPPPVIPEIVRKAGGVGPGFPNPADVYPSQAIHLGKEGPAVVQVCVDRAGRLTATPKLMQSAGFGPLDTSAVRLAQMGSGHYRPSTENGVPVASCYSVTIRFQLNNR